MEKSFEKVYLRANQIIKRCLRNKRKWKVKDSSSGDKTCTNFQNPQFYGRK